MTVTNGWSWRLPPTPGRACRTSTPTARSSAGSPMPDSWRSCGDPIAPAERMTSPSALTTCVPLRRPARVVLRLAEVRQDLLVAPPPGTLRLPPVVVQRATADVEHRVHRARAAEPLPPRDVQRPPVHVRLRLGREVPVELGVK